MIDTKTPTLDPTRIKTVLGNRVLIEWEQAPEDFLGGKIVRADKHRSAYFTGVVLKIGLDVDLDLNPIKEGDRLFFDQFSAPEKFINWDNQSKRYAFLEVDRQGAAFAIIPPRVKVRSDEGSLNYDA